MSLSSPEVSEVLPQAQQQEQDVLLILQSALELQQAGAYEDARALYEIIIGAVPMHADAQYGYAMLKVQMGEPADSLRNFEVALGLSPDNRHYWVNYISALFQSGQASAAWIALDLAQQRGVKGPDLDWLITQMARSNASPAPAAVAMPATTPNGTTPAATPGAPDQAVGNASGTATASGDKRKAPSSKVNKVNALIQDRQLEEAIAYARGLTAEYPSDGTAWGALGLALHQVGHFQDIVDAASRSVELQPNDLVIRGLLANALREIGRLSESEAHCRHILSTAPDDANTLWHLGSVLHCQKRYDEAAVAGRRAVELAPNNALAHLSFGMVQIDRGQVAEALGHLQTAIELDSNNTKNNSAVLFRLTHCDAIDTATLTEAHFAYGKRNAIRTSPKRHANVPDPRRKLRIGLVSGDLYNHAVSTYLGAVVEYLAKDPSVSLHFYYNFTIEDEVTSFLQAHAASWTVVTRMNDVGFAATVRRDEIDILIDLSGHTNHNRLPAFARKPAPIQVTWLGYPATTGLDAMDYFLADRHSTPPGLFDAQFSEKIVLLPAVAPYCPTAASPPVNTLPALHKGYITYGSFNRLNKVSRQVVALWARILHADPSARMIIGAIEGDADQQTCLTRFADEGIDAGRLSFRTRTETPVYLQQHHHVDICLDTFPYTGATTTINALWMGVPTVTIAGNSPLSRGSASWLGQLGLHQYIANDADDFVQRALALSKDLDALKQLRATLRERCMHATSIQPANVASSLSLALRAMWERWCAGQAPDSFEIEPVQNTVAPAAASEHALQPVT
ncbi:putative O-linked N-acetylglucosamine transferase (SPINDLY family) [Cupriavidus metallidurans]|jgi:predicted O-linked N-acetylglucosamine transferase (SPINDLY family)|uniref:O-linked N-acetylglucosamine transferase family protein n=1 Tax=Cupriavidus TaxID=106589 RepID=UPI0004934073|nr:tetratricopeptide repeat protein [Cupriavidus metallidurans]AVA35784.1 glycosyltransferase [Cupriavidus metallidurans]KWW35636.1 Beta-barrel assembly-enhancing protease [Cupriavidus metallidurans]MDE4921777.1 tetratricopeptide repeat protein [Cupriavidus metallidurans]